MPLLVNSVPNLAQGVSQQPDNLRYPGQCDEQINAWATVVEGLVKRPNTRHTSKLFTSKVSNDAFVHFIDRDDDNQFAAVIDNNDLSLFDLSDGSEKTVTITANAQTYLNNVTTPRTDVKALTVADYTFIANKEQTVALNSTVSSTLSYEALVFVKLGDYDKQYAVHTIFAGPDGEFDTSDDVSDSFDIISGDGVAGGGSDADTITIATQLYNILNNGGAADFVASATITHAGANYDPANPPAVTISGGGGSGATGIAAVSVGGFITGIVITNGGSNYSSAPTITIANPPSGGNVATATAVLGTVSAFNGTVERQDAIIKLTATEDFRIHTNDGLADQGLGLVYKEVSNITDLPAKAFNNFRVKVKGDTELVQDDYYVIFQTKDGNDFGEGTWVEDIGYGVKTEINANTMPLQLVPDATFNNWTLDVTDWSDRLVGDDETNPAPTFVGSKINDMFFFKNRLGILTDDSIVFSEADEFFNFWRATVLQLLDSSRIDVGVSHTRVAILKHAVPFQEKLLLFSENTQFVLRGSDLLTPKTVSITPATEYNSTPEIRPIVLNNYVYFPFKRNGYAGVTEYYVDNDTNIFDAAEVTAQVPTYIQSDVIAMVGTAVENVVALVNNQNRKEIFVYKYFWQGKEKIQSAWQKFTLSRDIIGLDFIESNLHLVTNDTTSTYLEVLPLENDLQDTGLTYTICLDSRIDGSALTTSFSGGVTTISGFPYDPVDVEIFSKAGHKYTFTRTSATAGTVSGDITSVPFFAGIPYNMLYKFSDQTLKQPTERGGRSASDYTFQTIRSGSLNYAETGHFVVEVTPKFRDTYSYAFNPDILGANLTLNSFTPQDGHFRFPVQAQPNDVTIEVKSSSALPVKLLAAEFESMMIPRSRRYGA
jgi:hypothetical protein